MFSLFAVVTNAPVVVFSLDWALVIQVVLAVFLPVLVGVVTTKVTKSSTKSILLAVLTLVTSLVTQLGDAVATNSAFDLGMALLLVIPAFVISVSTHYGFWKPTGVSQAAQNVGASLER